MTRKKAEPPKGPRKLRRGAEERLRKSKPPEGRFEDVDRESLIHEMQVHQVELKMQNEELKRLKDESEALAERYRDIYDFAPVGYFTLDSDGKIIEVNLAGACLLDIPRGRLTGRRLVNRVAPGSRVAFNAFIERVFLAETEKGTETETCEFLREGKPLFVAQLESCAILDARECRLAMIDVTERRKAEEGRRRYELLSLHERDIILFSDCDDGRILEANEAAARAYGYTREELRGLTVRDLSAAGDVEPADIPSRKSDDRLLFESLHRRHDGTVFPVDVSLHGVTAEGRRVLVSVIRDITGRKKEEAALAVRTLQLESANRELEMFSYSVSHDLQTPLRAIDGYARMIMKKQGERFDEETRAKFEVIRANIQRMGQLIGSLLAFTRLGKRYLSVRKVDIEAVVKEVWEEMKVINPDRTVSLKISGVPPGNADRTLLKEVFINILSNAIKYTRDKTDAVVEIGGRAQRKENVYHIRDNGIGFDMAYADKLFGMFQILHGPEYEGTGVGLAFAKRIIDLHGGRIWAEAECGKGATFYFTLPNR